MQRKIKLYEEFIQEIVMFLEVNLMQEKPFFPDFEFIAKRKT